MSVRFPYAINSGLKTEFSFKESIALNFIQICNRIKEGEQLVQMSEVFWPVVFIQAEPNYKLLIDKVGISKFDLSLNNIPSTAQIGHLLRNTKLLPEKILGLVKDVLQFRNIQEENFENKEENQINSEESFKKELKGIMSSEIIQGLGEIIHLKSIFNHNNFSCLEDLYTFDDAFNFGQQWIQTLKDIQGFMIRWKNIKEMIEKPFLKWKANLIVEEKDISERYKKEIGKNNGFDENIIKEKLDNEKNNIDAWVIKENKNTIEKIGKFFIGIDLIFEELRKKNKFFLQFDTLKANYSVNQVLVNSFKHIKYIKEKMLNSESELNSISDKLNQINRNLDHTQNSAKEKIEILNEELLNKKSNQETRIKSLIIARNQKIKLIKKSIEVLTQLFEEIEEIIHQKIKSTKFDEIKFRNWQIDDNITHITTPTMNMYIPIGIGIIEDEEEEERIEIIFPSKYIEKSFERIPLTPKFLEFEKNLSEILDSDMRFRSNFEFACERASSYKNEILEGMGILKKKYMVNFSIYDKYIEILNSLEK